MKYVLGVGTNLGNRKENIIHAMDAVNLTPYTDVLMRSGIYETEPVGYAKQDNFYNCNLLVESRLEPNEMLGLCLGIESGLGRKRGIKNGPRIIDLDLLFAENKKIYTTNLQVPHPRINERRFVLIPLLDLFPNGTAFDFEFQSYIDKIEGQFVNQIEEKEIYFDDKM